MFKNTASQSVTLYAVDATTGLPKTGDAANMTFYVSKDDGTVNAISASSGVPTEVDNTKAKGLYKIALSQSETNADKLLFSGKSTTANVVVTPAVIYTLPASLASAIFPQYVGAGLKKNQIPAVIPFVMRLSTDHTSLATGKTVTVQVSLDGGAFANAANPTATEISNGWYYWTPTAADVNAGAVAVRAVASACDDTVIPILTTP
jgi:hypothetical protein